MADFEKMAAQARQASDELIASKQNMANEARREAERDRDEAIAYLSANVVPVMHEAARAFLVSKVPCAIVASWEQKVAITPSISFQCVGPMINNKMGGHSTPAGVIVEVSRKSGETKLRVGADLKHPRPEVIVSGDIGETLPEAISKSLSTYHESLTGIVSGDF